MSRNPGGPTPISRPPGALARAQQPAPEGAMRSGAAGRSSSHDSEGGRGRQVWRSNVSDDGAEDAIGPLPKSASPSGSNGAGAADSNGGGRRSSSRDSSLARRLSAGLSGVIRGRSASGDRESKTLSRQNTEASTILDAERGRERGRDAPVAATGRGGAGNMFRSPSRGRPVEDKGETAAQQAYAEKQHTVTSGRGGVGNVRSPSRDPLERTRVQEMDKQEREIQAAALRNEEHAPHAVGRGGVGNVKRESSADRRGRDSTGGSGIRSMSRSRSREPRSGSRPRVAPSESGNGNLGALDETASSTGTESTAANGKEGGHHGLLGKIAHHLPGHHHSSS